MIVKNEFVTNLIIVAASFFVAFLLTFIIRKIISVFIKKYSTKLKADPTNFSFIKNSVGFVFYTAASIYVVYSIPYLRAVGSALFAGAGILAIIVGFASQKAFSNIISGVFILIFKPFKILDTIEFKDGQKGIVEEITLRHTVIKDYENRRIIMPNSIISEETIINSDIQDEKIKKHIVFSISYDSDIDKAINIIRDEAVKHPLTIDNRTIEEKKKKDPVVQVRVIALSDFSVDIKAYIWTAGNDNAFVLNCDLLKSVKQRFDKEKIEIPFPYRTIVFKNPMDINTPNKTEVNIPNTNI